MRGRPASRRAPVPRHRGWPATPLSRPTSSWSRRTHYYGGPRHHRRECGILTRQIVPRLRCAAIAGAANNQLAEPDVAGLLHQRGIVWVPDYVVSAGGVIYALAVELDKEDPQTARTRVQGIGDTVGLLLDVADRTGTDPAAAALELASARLSAGTRRAAYQGNWP